MQIMKEGKTAQRGVAIACSLFEQHRELGVVVPRLQYSPYLMRQHDVVDQSIHRCLRCGEVEVALQVALHLDQRVVA